MKKYVNVAKKININNKLSKKNFIFNCSINLMCYKPKIHYKMANYFPWVNFLKSKLLNSRRDSKPFPYEQTKPSLSFVKSQIKVSPKVTNFLTLHKVYVLLVGKQSFTFLLLLFIQLCIEDLKWFSKLGKIEKIQLIINTTKTILKHV